MRYWRTTSSPDSTRRIQVTHSDIFSISKIPTVNSFRSALSILANIECPIGSTVNYSSIMFEMAKTIYPSDILRPSVFGSLGTIAGKISLVTRWSISNLCFFSWFEICWSQFDISRIDEFLSLASLPTFTTWCVTIIYQRAITKFKYWTNSNDSREFLQFVQ